MGKDLTACKSILWWKYAKKRLFDRMVVGQSRVGACENPENPDEERYCHSGLILDAWSGQRSLLRSAKGLEILKGIVAIPNLPWAKQLTEGCEAGMADGNSPDGLYCHVSLIADGWSSRLLPPRCL